MKKISILFTALIFGFAAIYTLSNSLEKSKPQIDEKYADEDLYFTPNQLKAGGYDFRGLIADWYWINSLQYVGGKLLNSGEKVNINDLSNLNPRLLYPMLDTATTLDPQFMAVYAYGASVLPAIDNNLAIKLLEKGIAANPNEWRLYQNLGYIYWQMKDYPKAAESYAAGAAKPNAPAFLKQMSVNMQAQGGSREFAREVYKQMFDAAEDEQTKAFADLRYQQTEALDQLDAIRDGLRIFKQQKNRCPQNWRETMPIMSKTVPPYGDTLPHNQKDELLDPSGTPYQLLEKDGVCSAYISTESKIPQPN